jgi:tripartite-type tricarboxylate transporter receptor subunit TctC
MTLYFRNYLIAATALASINASAAQPATATQSYPTKPVRFIVGFAPGGATDIIARALAQKLSDAFGQQVVVDNRAGGGGTIAAMMAAKSPPDGYTMLMGTISTLATNVSTYKNLPYDPLKDFAPVTLAAATPYFVTVNASLPSTLKDFIALAKAKPGSMNFGSSGAGGGAHLSAELFRSMAGIELTHIPYKGAALALTEVIGGQIQMSFSQPLIVLPHLKGGRVKALAITSAKRSIALPEYPTIAESGLPGYESSSWQGIVMPARTPPAIIARLHDELVKGLRAKDIGERLAAEGTDPGGNTPAEFGAYIKREIEKWARVVKSAGLKTD